MKYSKDVGHQAWLLQQAEKMLSRDRLVVRLRKRAKVAQSRGEDDIWTEMADEMEQR